MIDIWRNEDPWPDGASELLLVGPPGTGKTRNVLDAYVWPALRADEAVLATSYTRAAAEELRKRTGKEFGKIPNVYKEDLSTLHSEASRRCRHLHFKLGEEDKSAPQKVEEEDESEDWEVGIVARIEEESSRSGIAAWDRTRNLYPEDIGLSIEDRLRHVGLYGGQLYDAVVAVEQDLHKRHRDGVLVSPDFTTLLEQALVHGDSRRLDLLVIDEAQDCTPLQWALIDKWARSSARLLLVGDPDQSIYAWAGADGHRLLSWIRAGRCTRRLAQSYRVPAAAHRFARQVIRQVTDREDAPYHPKVDKETGQTIEGSICEEYGDEAWFAIGRAQDAGESAFVLARTRAGVSRAADDLERLSIPHLCERGHGILGRPGKPSKALLVVEALQGVANGWALHPDGARALVAALSTVGLKDVLVRGAKGNMTELVQGKRSRVEIDALEELGLPTGALLDLWRLLTTGERTGLLPMSPEKEAARFFLASSVSAPDVVVLARWLVAYGERLLPMANLVRVTTAHGAKGREAKVVVVDARARIRGQQSPAEVDEDRRVLYVAVTRTERDLVLLRTMAGEDWLSMHGLSVEP